MNECLTTPQHEKQIGYWVSEKGKLLIIYTHTKIIVLYIHIDNCGPTICIPFAEDYTDWVAPGIGRQLTYMTLQGFVYFGLLLLVEYHVPQRLCYAIRGDWDDDVEMQRCGSAEDDSDVVKEKRRINTTDLKKLLMTDSLILMDLYKRYGSFVAVNHVSVGIPQRECFGLLGQNGAGKTTTFKMLTGQIMVSGGNAYLKECDIKNTLDKVGLWPPPTPVRI